MAQLRRIFYCWIKLSITLIALAALLLPQDFAGPNLRDSERATAAQKDNQKSEHQNDFLNLVRQIGRVLSVRCLLAATFLFIDGRLSRRQPCDRHPEW